MGFDRTVEGEIAPFGVFTSHHFTGIKRRRHWSVVEGKVVTGACIFRNVVCIDLVDVA